LEIKNERKELKLFCDPNLTSRHPQIDALFWHLLCGIWYDFQSAHNSKLSTKAHSNADEKKSQVQFLRILASSQTRVKLLKPLGKSGVGAYNKHRID